MTLRIRVMLRVAGLLMLLALLMTACSRATPTPTPAPIVPPFTRDELRADAAVAEVQATRGGTIALNDGAQATLSPGALVGDATVTFRTATDTPGVPIPSSILGQAYELAVDGSEMSGVALIRLPLPPGVTPDQYKIAPYRWTGRLWERVATRESAGGVQFGVPEPGVFALLGEWRLADAALALIRPDTPPGQQSIPMTIVGQYRYSAVPAMQDGLVPAQLVLKQDTSGGAGLVSGDPNLDSTVGETTLYFKPDPAQSEGRIEFNHVFDVLPGLLQLDPGVNTRFYAVLTVEDSAAPTRRFSTGVDYTQILPIQLQDMKVVRPILQGEERLALRWKIMLNGLTFQTPPAPGAELALQPIIDQGGVGDYKIVLEAQSEGQWAAISNEVSVQLALRPTATLEPGQPTPTPALIAIATPGPVVTPPAVPTRRPTPAIGANGGGLPGVTPTVTPTATVTVSPSPTRPDWANVFRADKYAIAPGECVNLQWQVENVISVTYQGQPATGNETRRECPTETTTYILRVQSSAGTQEHTVTVQVSAGAQSAITFTADRYTVAPGGCATLSWSATNVKEVRLNGEGVAGVASRQVCLTQTTDYELTVVDANGQPSSMKLTITVSQSPGAAAGSAFWAEQYTLPAGGCTTLRWNVQNVQSVYLDGQGVTGAGSQQACPTVTQFYTLEITDSTGTTKILEVVLTAGEPFLQDNEVIIQGIVNAVTRVNDVDPLEQGDQPGYNVTIDGIRNLWVGPNGFNQANVTVGVPQAVIDLAENGPTHWPLRPGQQVEMRATCEGATCRFDYTTEHYLYWRSQ
jgi:hypothetical protein